MANDKDKGNRGLPVNFDRIGAGDVQSLRDIIDGGSKLKPENMNWLERTGKTPLDHDVIDPKEPVSGIEPHEKEASNQQDASKKDEPEKEALVQHQEHEIDEPEKD